MTGQNNGVADSDDRYRHFFQSIPQGFCVIRVIFGEDGRALDYMFLEANDAFAAQTGLEGAIGRSVREMVPDHEQVWIDLYGEVARSGVPAEFEQRADALGRYYRVFAFPLGEPGEQQVAVLFEDIKERVEAEADLRRRESRYRFLDDLGHAVSNLSNADEILATTTRMTAQYLNLSNCAYADMDPDEDGFTIRGDWAAPASPSIVGHYSLADFGKLAVQELSAGRPLVINDNLAEIAPEEARTFQDIGIAATICMPLVKDGRLVALMAIHDKVPHRWSDEELLIIREVTERSWAHVQRAGAEAELRKLNATLELRVDERTAQLLAAEDALRQSQKMEAIGQLTGGVAHDFNNLLTIIISAVGLLQRGKLPEEKRAKYIDAIGETAERAARLTAQLLAFARRQTLKPTVFDAGERIEAVAEMLRTIVGGRIALMTETEPNVCFVQADMAQLETALVNMVVNARDAMDGAGRLTISVKPAGADPGRSEFVAICVSDTGCGIPADAIERVFEPFYTTKGVGKGTGLGLSQVYGFAKQSGGEIRVESEPGRGTTFTMCLPRAAAPPPPAERDTAEAPPLGARGDLLVVEDNEQVGNFAAQILDELGFSASLARDADEAIRLLEQEPGRFVAVFTDVVMPGRSGIDLAREIRDRWPRLPVVLTSGYSEVLAQGENHGFDLLQKPYSLDGLTQSLAKALAPAN
jgi:signal transduction histidine kinase/CheY-like chemotaxis protein